MFKVSVIIPVYNAEHFIERCARSLFLQTLDEIQFIFIDDCSSYNSIILLKEVLEKYPNRKSTTIIVRHQYNRGVSAARNTGLKYAKGEYIAYCDSDDFVAESMYEDMYNRALNTNADAVLCEFYMHYSYFDNRYVQTVRVKDKISTLRDYITTSWTLISNIIVRKAVYDLNSITFLEQISYCEDFHLNFRLLYFSNIISQIDRPYYYYNRGNENSAMHTLGDKHIEAERFVYEDIIEMMRRDDTIRLYEKEISYRILKSKQDMVLSPILHEDFMRIYPDSHKYICSCPCYFCNNKIKIMMWLLVHRCRWILLVILQVRRIINK